MGNHRTIDPFWYLIFTILVFLFAVYGTSYGQFLAGGGGGSGISPNTNATLGAAAGQITQTTALNTASGGSAYLSYSTIPSGAFVAVGNVITGTSIPDGDTITSLNGTVIVTQAANGTFAAGTNKVIPMATTGSFTPGMQCIDTTSPTSISDGNTIFTIQANTSITMTNAIANASGGSADSISCYPTIGLGGATTATVLAGGGPYTIYPSTYVAGITSPTGGLLVNGGINASGTVGASFFSLMPSVSFQTPGGQNGCPTNSNGMELFTTGQIAMCVAGSVSAIGTPNTWAVNRSQNGNMTFQVINTNNGNAAASGVVLRNFTSGAANDCDEFMQNGASATTLTNSSSALNLLYNFNANCTAVNFFIANQATGSNVNLMEFTSGSLIEVPHISTDSGQTATATVCEDTTSHALYFGSGTGGICKGTSSVRFKTDVVPVTDGLDQVMKLKPINFHYKPEAGDPLPELYGFLAEDMDKVIPKLVGRDPEDRPSSIDLLGLVPVLTKAIQQQQTEIADLKQQLEAIKASK